MALDVEPSSASVELAIQLRDLLCARRLRIVLAESCTGGNVAATLTRLPGISEQLCGCFVVYRNASKSNWLGISTQLLDDPEIGPVSCVVTEQLVLAALLKTPEADLGVAVTGHLGPGCPPKRDGQIVGAFALRHCAKPKSVLGRLVTPAPATAHDIDRRSLRLIEATNWLMKQTINWLSE